MAIGTEEMILIVVVVLVLFGATAIPKLARAMGRAKGEFQRAKSEFDAEAAKAEHEAPPTQLQATARNLGIDPTGKSDAELKTLIQQKLA